jgi:hypothetical protein
VSSGSRTRLPNRKGSDVTTCTMDLDPLGGLQCAACPVAPDPASLWGGLWAATRPTTLCGLWDSSINKSLVGMPV